MKHLEQIIIDYINKPNTDFAIFIDGEWGCGKTYFWKNRLTPIIENLNSSADKKWSTLYVSLNGITSSDEIISRIISEKIGVQNRSKITRIALGTLGTAISVASNLFSTGDVQNTLMKNFNINTIIDFSNTVICFDDIERISYKIDIKDLFGFINSTFVENNFVKVILIGNSIELIKKENELDGVQEKDYLRIKEKLIGREIKFNLDVITFYDNFISDKRLSLKLSAFLKENKELFLYYFSEFRLKNLRTIKFFLENLRVIIEAHPIEKIPPQVLRNLTYFIFVISNEFKSGSGLLNLIPKNEVRHIFENGFMFRLIEKGDDNSSKKSPSFLFCDKYLKDRGLFYHFFDSIFEHIVFGYWDTTKYQQEISSFLGSKWEGLANKLSNYAQLSDEEFTETVAELLEGIKDGELNLYRYPSLFKLYYGLIKENLLSVDLHEMVELFKLGINKSVDMGNIVVTNEDEINLSEGNIEEINEIIRYIKKFHELLKLETEKQNIKRIIDEFDHNGDFRNLLNQYYGKQLFKHFTPNEYFNKIRNSSNATISNFIFFLYNKYSNEEFKFKDDCEGLTELASIIRSSLDPSRINSKEKLKNHLLFGLIDQIEKILLGLEKKSSIKLNQ